MPGLLNLPEEVMIQHLFPVLGHNNLLRLRRVCKLTKNYVNRYLWTPKKGCQGQWTLEINPNNRAKSLQLFLQMQLPPPSRLHINFPPLQPIFTLGNRRRRLLTTFFEDPHLPEFMRIYSKFITHLKITRIEIPFMSASANELDFYESLIKLEHLHCWEIRTGGAAQFQQRMATEGSSLLPLTFRTLKSFQFDLTDCPEPTLTFVRELKCLETLSHCSLDDDDNPTTSSSISFLMTLVEDPGCKLKMVDWKESFDNDWNPRKLLQLFAKCSDKGVKIKGLSADYLVVLLCDSNGELDDTEIFDEETEENVFQVNYQRNSFIGRVIHSLAGIRDTLFLLEELHHLEELRIESTAEIEDQFRLWQRHGHPNWPNLRKLNINLDSERSSDLMNFLIGGQVERPKLQELALRSDWSAIGNRSCSPIPDPTDMVVVSSFRNLKKLTLQSYTGNCGFFVKLWEGLPLLESVELVNCLNLGNQGFIGYSKESGAVPVFVKLKKLKHLSIDGVHQMRRFTDRVFRDVFSQMELKSLKLSGDENEGKKSKVTVEGIRALLTGKFAESIEKLDFDELYLHGMSEYAKSKLKSCFRSSKML